MLLDAHFAPAGVRRGHRRSRTPSWPTRSTPPSPPWPDDGTLGGAPGALGLRATRRKTRTRAATPGRTRMVPAMVRTAPRHRRGCRAGRRRCFEIFAPYKWEALFQRWPDLLTAFGTTVGISVLALVIALALGILFGVLSVSRVAVLRGITRVYVEVVQNVPLLLQVFVFYAIFPPAGACRWPRSGSGSWPSASTTAATSPRWCAAASAPSTAGSSRRRRARASGYWQSMFVIILPQAIRIIMPPLAVQAANLVKNTSVLALIAGGELMYFSNSFAGATSYYGPVYVVAAAAVLRHLLPAVAPGAVPGAPHALAPAPVRRATRARRWPSRPDGGHAGHARHHGPRGGRRRWRAAWAPCTRRWTSPRRGRPLRRATRLHVLGEASEGAGGGEAGAEQRPA